MHKDALLAKAITAVYYQEIATPKVVNEKATFYL